MNKQELVDLIAADGRITKAEAELRLEQVLSALETSLSQGGVDIRGFGSLKVVDRAARAGRNLATGEAIEIPATKTVKFKPSKALVEKVK